MVSGSEGIGGSEQPEKRRPCGRPTTVRQNMDRCPGRLPAPTPLDVLETPYARFPGTSKAGATGLEPATSGVTGRRSNQLSYAP
jgi:hypothetical protein